MGGAQQLTEAGTKRMNGDHKRVNGPAGHRGRAAGGWPRLLAGLAAGVALGVMLGLGLWTLVPSALGWDAYLVTSDSMAPTLRAGDVLFAAPASAPDASTGRVVLFADPDRPGRTVVHRVVDRLPDGRLRTRGDANPAVDTSPVDAGLVRGVPRLRVPFAGVPVHWFRAGHGAAVFGALDATFAASTSSPSSFAARPAFPSYAEVVLGAEPIVYYRLDEPPSSSGNITTGAADSSGNDRAGLFDGPTAGSSTRYAYGEGSGPVVRDDSGNANPAVRGPGTAWAPGQGCGGALTLNGEGDAYLSSARPALRTDQPFTVATRVRLDDLDGTKALVSQDGANTAGFVLEYRDEDGGTLAFRAPRSDAADAEVDVAAAAVTLTAGQWFHVAGVYRPHGEPGEELELFVNGARVASTTRAAPTWNASGSVQVGRARSGGGYAGHFAGAVDETRLYRRALTTSELGVIGTVGAGSCGNAMWASPMSAGQPGALGGSEAGSTAVAFIGTSGARTLNSLAATPAFSVEVWFRATGSQGGELVAFRNGSSVDRRLYLTGDGRLVFGVNPGAVQRIESAAAYNDGAWHQAVATLGDDGMRLYVDNALVASDPAVTTAGSFTGHWWWGGSGASFTGWSDPPPSGRFVGVIDEFSVYDRALTAQEVAWRYRARNQ